MKDFRKTQGRKGKVFAFIFLVPLLILAASAAVWQLWNWLMPDLFGFKQIEFLQALGLFVLSKILLGPVRGFGGGRGRRHWRHRMRRRFHEMRERAHRI
ncbi:MAG: hypothetical protein K8S54_06375 [Spirochaetia bacterium]|nr:hypothetical protein [Spirochaetia bacterium]